VLEFADGFVIGTEVVKRQSDPAEFKKYVAELGSVSAQ
jgi:tryptophan synthase alpha subunit